MSLGRWHIHLSRQCGEHLGCHNYFIHFQIDTLSFVVQIEASHLRTQNVDCSHCYQSPGVEYVQNNAGASSAASMSLGGGTSASLDTAVNNLVASGVPCAVAAGNDDGDACNSSPARAANVSMSSCMS